MLTFLLIAFVDFEVATTDPVQTLLLLLFFSAADALAITEDAAAVAA